MIEESDYVKILDVSGSSFEMKGEKDMGKDLKGKELGKGIIQRKDGRYSARYNSQSGKRIEKYFDKKEEAKRWLAQAKYDEEHSNIAAASNMTFDAWFHYWVEVIKGKTVRYNTIRNYNERYEHNIKEYLGHMMLSDIKPLHCQQVLNAMEEKYAGSTIEQVRITLHTTFKDAVDNELIPKNPMKKSVKLPKPIEKKQRVLTKEEQDKFLKAAEKSSYYDQYLFLLQTGMRAGELMGLEWGDCDFENRKIKIQRTMEHRYPNKIFETGDPKSESGKRTIPMSQIAYDILQKRKKENANASVVVEQFKDNVFLNRNGIPTKNSVYDNALKVICEKAGIEPISMHTLRHTFATRMVESGVLPKVLQRMMGHSNFQTTMNLYVHATEDELFKAMKIFEDNVEFTPKLV